VSDPKSPAYGQHKSNDEVHSLVAPSPAAIASVQAHLESHGIVTSPATPNSDMIVAQTTVRHAEAALGCEYFQYTHGESGLRVLRTPRYSLPQAVSGAVAFASPTVRLPSTTSPHARVATSPTDDKGMVGNSPKSLRALYNVGDTVGKAADNRQAVTGFLGQHFSQRDLDEFHLLFDKKNKGQKLGLKGDDPKGLLSGVEAMLDAEYMPALGANITSEFWGFSGRAPDNPQNEPFLKWLYLVANTSDASVTKLFSTSYGEPEASVSVAYADRINVEFVKAGSRGISLLFASGDSGADCSASNKFTPNWPAASPYITSVGGTYGSNPEAAAGLSSGGFSNRYGTAAWQKDAVAAYLAGPNVPNRSFFNASGRGFPDIAAQAEGFTVVSNLIPQPGVAGTSCASPTAAGVISLLNDLRLQAGKPSLGFLNHFLYQTASALNDITTGASGGGCSTERGYSAVKGWDPVTGLGTPDYTALAKAVQALP
jgi:tripeptidyl-peptidase-1